MSDNSFAVSTQPQPASGEHLVPRIAISVGDAAGIGPELALACVAMPEIYGICSPILFGPADSIKRVAELQGLHCPPVIRIDQLSASTSPAIVDVGDVEAATIQPGVFSAATGQASFDAVCSGIDAATGGTVAGLVTGPIQKEAWNSAGIAFPGHTELLASRTGTTGVRMMLTSAEISCVLVTIHVPLADVSGLLTIDAIAESIRLAAAAMRRRHGRPVHVTVCGLNPHAGENGLFSHGEEDRLIRPAIEIARSEGIDAHGPMPPDTAFTPATRSRTDVYVCMYHDQGLIPLKAIAFDDAVNVTLGLPIVRTSVDHGTAMDLAWQGIASPSSMRAAIQMAVDLARDPQD